MSDLKPGVYFVYADEKVPVPLLNEKAGQIMAEYKEKYNVFVVEPPAKLRQDIYMIAYFSIDTNRWEHDILCLDEDFMRTYLEAIPESLKNDEIIFKAEVVF